jgi:hypothetical protein
MGALLGAVLGVSLALIVESAETSSAVAGPERERVAVLAASPPSTTPASGSRAASSQDAGNADDPSGNQHGESTDRADQRDRKADKNGDGGKDKADSRSKDKSGKGKNK